MTITLSRPQALMHGGNLKHAIKRYSIQHESWLDMSTGVSPWSWPIPKVDKQIWHELPDTSLALRNVAADYYNTDHHLVAVTPGSQLAIRLIPQLFAHSSVAVPKLGYQEHAYSWALAGHKTVSYQNIDELLTLTRSTPLNHAVVINPNNPTGELAKPEQLSQLASSLDGQLFVDEAFADYSTPNSSAVDLADNIVAFRSLGKFFGLAGARIGFVLADRALIEQLNTLLEPWSCSGPSLFIAQHALADKQWQTMQRKRITEHQNSLSRILAGLAAFFQLDKATHSGLFHTLFGDKNAIDELHESLARAGIWTRSYNQDDTIYWLRFSLPPCVNEFRKRISPLIHQG